MPKRTNPFQQVVAVIHEHMARGATVEHSAMVTPIRGGPPREVDVLVRSTVAGHFGDGPEGLILSSPQGSYVRSSSWRKRFWNRAVDAAGLGRPLRFHDLRHTHAAWLISQGAHTKAIQTRLGHSSITVTMDTYGHLMEGLDAELAEGLDALQRGRCRDSRWR